MMNLQDILFGVRLKQVVGLTNQEVISVHIDSREVKPSSLFVAIKGNQMDGHKFIRNATDSGATVIVCEEIPLEIVEGVTYIVVDNSRKAIAIIAANFYDNPSKKIKLVGVTGTNGKTTIVTLLHQLFTDLGAVAGLLSTVENKIGQEVLPSQLTTPDALAINKMLSEMVDFGCEYCFMEVSSHAIDQHRILGLEYVGGVFTNITRDHLDYHETFKAYIAAKQKFFTQLPKSAFAIYNQDDKNGLVMVQNTNARKISYGMKSFSSNKVKVLEQSFEGLLININGIDLYTILTGTFNAMNLLAVFVTAIELGEDEQKVYEKLSALKGATGRFEKVVSPTGVIGIIDYAHTPDSLEKTLQTIENIRTGIEQLITVVGAGGNRDKGKRPLMAEIAADKSNKVILTSDNPRDENPNDIIEDMMKGVKITQRQKVLSISNRREAIQTAVTIAQPNDIILLAGKGHEKYQEINGEKFPFDDKEELIKAYKMFDK